MLKKPSVRSPFTTGLQHVLFLRARTGAAFPRGVVKRGDLVAHPYQQPRAGSEAKERAVAPC
eukprot:4713624-Prymnesium_polylepis.1